MNGQDEYYLDGSEYEEIIRTYDDFAELQDDELEQLDYLDEYGLDNFWEESEQETFAGFDDYIPEDE